MALELHPDCKSRLIEVVAEGLSLIKVDNGCYLEPKSVPAGLGKAENVIPEKGPLRDQLVEYVGDYPVSEFIIDILGTELREKNEFVGDTPSIALTHLEGYGDPEATAKFLVDQLESLPWKYTLSIELPVKLRDLFQGDFVEFSVADHVRLVTHKADLDERFPLMSEDENRNKRIYGEGTILTDRIDPEWSENSVYFQIDVNGFVDTYGTTMPAVRAKYILRSICGLAIATRLFRYKLFVSPFGLSPKNHIYVHKHYDGASEIVGRFDLEDHSSSAFNGLELNDLDGRLKDDADKKKWVVERLHDMRAVLSAGERSEKILLASQWLFDSYAGKDELLSFVQTMVVLEILLGETDSPDEIGLGELLRNRCAYLIGRTHNERSYILGEFKKIYRVRSQIVHRGKSRLTPDERVLFTQLRMMCRRVIQAELDLLKADIAQS